MFCLITHNPPSIMTTTMGYDGFDLVTIATGSERLYRITREVLNYPETLKHYDFKVSFAGMQVGQLVNFQIPYRSTDYSHPGQTGHIPVISLLPTGSWGLNGDASALMGGERLDGHLFKLIYIDEGMFTREAPSLIDPDRIYTVGSTEIKFVFFRLFEGIPRFTGTMGSLSLNSDPIPNVTLNPNQRISTVVVSGVIHYIIRLDSTPNIIYTTGDTSFEGNILEEYLDDSGMYLFQLGSKGNGFSGIQFEVSVMMKKQQGGSYDGPRPFILEDGGIQSVSYIREFLIGPAKVFLFSVTSFPGVEEINIRAGI